MRRPRVLTFGFWKVSSLAEPKSSEGEPHLDDPANHIFPVAVCNCDQIAGDRDGTMRELLNRELFAFLYCGFLEDLCGAFQNIQRKRNSNR